MRRHIHPRILTALAGMAIMLALASCNPQKKNTALSRQYTALITRYNIHYNGDKHFRETLADMENGYEDDFSRLLPMHPVEASGSEALPGAPGIFDRSIEKAQKAIQLRSIKKKPRRQPRRRSDPEYQKWLKRDEYNPFLHNDWMMLGKSQYFNGDFSSAASTFLYIAKHFTWLPSTVAEAKLWQARCCVSLGWLDEADIILSRIKPAQIQDDSQLSYLYNFVYADYWIHRRHYSEAIPYLEIASAHASGTQRTRLTFLLGQLYQLTGNKESALQAYKRAGNGSSTPHRTKFNARIKQTEVISGADASDEIKALNRMLRYSSNKQYADQLHYAIGNLQMSRGDTANAIKSYRQAISAPGTERQAVAQALLALGAIYYSMADYLNSQSCYAEALPMLDASMPDYNAIRHRSDILDRYAVYAHNVILQDSLLKLAAMPPQQQRAVAERLAQEQMRQEREQAQALAEAQNMGLLQAGTGGALSDTRARQFSISTDDSWYFYNKAVRDAGKSAFQRQWGARRLEDDWRRSNKHTFAESDIDEHDDNSESIAESHDAPEDDNRNANAKATADNPQQPEFYLAQIPQTPAQLTSANEILQEGLYNMGLILRDDINDASAAAADWQKLLSRYPDNPYRLDIYHNMYMMEMRQHQKAAAEHWRQLILTQFAESPYGIALKNGNYFEHLMQMDQATERLYADTYRQYLANANDSVHAAAELMQREYPMSQLMPQFMLLDALAYLTDGNPAKFNATLKEMVARYPDASGAPIASAWLKGMAQGRPLYSPRGNLHAMVWEMPLSADSASVAPMQETADLFTRDPDSPQVIAMVFPMGEVSSNELLFQVARHNFGTFVVKDYDLDALNFGDLGIILISGFENAREVEHYLATLRGSDTLSLPASVRVVHLSRQDFDTLMRQGLSFDHYFQPE